MLCIVFAHHMVCLPALHIASSSYFPFNLKLMHFSQSSLLCFYWSTHTHTHTLKSPGNPGQSIPGFLRNLEMAVKLSLASYGLKTDSFSVSSLYVIRITITNVTTSLTSITNAWTNKAADYKTHICTHTHTPASVSSGFVLVNLVENYLAELRRNATQELQLWGSGSGVTKANQCLFMLHLQNHAKKYKLKL